MHITRLLYSGSDLYKIECTDVQLREYRGKEEKRKRKTVENMEKEISSFLSKKMCVFAESIQCK